MIYFLARGEVGGFDLEGSWVTVLRGGALHPGRELFIVHGDLDLGAVAKVADTLFPSVSVGGQFQQFWPRHSRGDVHEEISLFSVFGDMPERLVDHPRRVHA